MLEYASRELAEAAVQACLWVMNEALSIPGVRGKLSCACLFEALNNGLHQQ